MNILIAFYIGFILGKFPKILDRAMIYIIIVLFIFNCVCLFDPDSYNKCLTLLECLYCLAVILFNTKFDTPVSTMLMVDYDTIFSKYEIHLNRTNRCIEVWALSPSDAIDIAMRNPKNKIEDRDDIDYVK